jgi:hypothetical protein
LGAVGVVYGGGMNKGRHGLKKKKNSENFFSRVALKN